jgi:class 3 adenylate cyclase/tetratricopeptide (TPR) repeat protein
MTTSSAVHVADGFLRPYVPRLLATWSPSGADARHMRVTGSVAFVDISGFTRLTERLARKGKVGAEEMSDILSATFAGLLTEAMDDGADLVKWGGDAVLLLFQGADHAQRAARASHRMRAALRVIGRVPTTSGTVVLRMSVGVHSGEFDFFLVGDPEIHRELLISGPAASTTAVTEAAAEAGEIGLSRATSALLDPRLLGGPLLDGHLLKGRPRLDVALPVALPVAVPNPRRPDGFSDPASVLPPPIRAHLLSGTIEPEHRLITVAFVQFSGTDAMLEADGPAALAEALDHLVRNVQHACADHDVTFFETDINRDGGKIMLTAGAPRSADHDEERMLRVARMVLDRAGRLPLRIGINRGHVFTGDFGPDFRRTVSVKGDAINLAARVMGKAAPGQALATLEVVRRSQTLFRTTDLPPFMVKGKSQPVRATAVGALVGTRTDERPTFPLVGRDEEMAALREALDDVRRGAGRLVEIVGEPGIGKSRLVAELLTDVEVPVLTASCEQYESSTPYFPFRRLLREVLRMPSDADADEVAGRLSERVAADVPELVPWLPLLGAVMDVHFPSTRETEELDEQFRKGRLEEVVAELLGRVLTDPTVVVVDDAHLMDESSADLLQRLVDDLHARPWLVIEGRRDDATGFVPVPGPNVASLRPDPLTPEAALEFVQAALDDHPLPDQALADLVRRGGGNPMFLEALVRDADRSGSVANLPESVEALVTSQIDRLDPADRTALRYAAVLGLVVDETALDTLLEEHDARVPDGAMQRLADFLVRDRSGGLRFRNGLMRDVAYEGLPFRSRKVLHDQVGQAIERGTPAPEGQCEVLSLHFFHAGRHEKAWRYSVLAGERALAKYAHGEAIEFFARAAHSAPHHDVVGPAVVARVYEQLADSRWLVGLPQEAAEAYAQARRHLRGDPVRLAAIVEKEARIDQRRRKHTQAMRRISRGLHELESVSGPSAQVARSLLARRYAFSRFNQGRVDEALHWAGVAAGAAEESLDKDALAQAYEVLNYIYASSGREEPLPYGRLALQAYVELGNLPHQGHCLNNLAAQDVNAGRWDESIASFRRASDLFRRIGDTASEANATYNEAEMLVRQRRHELAQPLLRDVLRIARAVEDDELVALAQRELARTVAATGDVDQGIALLQDARARFEALEEQSEVLATDAVTVEVAQDAERFGDAGDLLRGLVHSVPGATVSATVHRLVGRQRVASGDAEGARAAFHDGLESAERAGDLHEEGLLLLELAAVAPTDDQRDEAMRRGTRALDRLGVVRPA